MLRRFWQSDSLFSIRWSSTLVWILCLTGAVVLFAAYPGQESGMGLQANTAQDLLTTEFPGARVSSSSVQFSPAEQALIRKKSRRKLSSLRFYSIQQAGKVVAYGFVDRHRVRSRKETLLILVNRDTSVRRIEVLEFREPIEYKAPQRWLESLYNKTSKDYLRPGSDLSSISGATLTSQAVSRAVRLAVHTVAIIESRS